MKTSIYKRKQAAKIGEKPTFLELKVSEECELMDFLLNQLTKKSRNNIKSLLSHKEVFVDRVPTSKFNTPLKKGQIVRVSLPKQGIDAQRNPLNIIYEDDQIIAIDKPAGLLSIATDKEQETTAYHLLMEYVRRENPTNRIFVVHRLDRDTSGVLVVAKNEAIKFELQNNWNDIVISRGYTAVVEGEMPLGKGRLHSWLLETKTHLIYSSQTKGDGLEAITCYDVIKNNEQNSLLDIRLETGRKNQIRVQLHDIGFPIVGDKKYGGQTNPLRRLCLHAHLLEIKYPVTGETLHLEAKIPGKFLGLVDKNKFK